MNVIARKITIKNPDNVEIFENEFRISQGPRYFHRDNQGEPYYYNFDIESQHYLDSKQLFVRANEIIIETLDEFKDTLVKIVEGDDIQYVYFIHFI